MVPGRRVYDVAHAALLEQYDDPENVGTLRRIIDKMKDQEWVEFDTADRALCALWIWDEWRGSLADVFEQVNLDACPSRIPRCERSGCSKTIKQRTDGGRRKRFCSPACRQAAYLHRKGKYKPRPKGLCPNGHDRSPENTRRLPGGTIQCRVCARDTARRRRAKAKRRAAAEA
jgi:hypothetical protein